MTHLADLRCACGEAKLIAVAPGSEPQFTNLFGEAPNDGTRTEIALSPGRPDRARCAECWPWANRTHEMGGETLLGLSAGSLHHPTSLTADGPTDDTAAAWANPVYRNATVGKVGTATTDIGL